jgi:cation transport protein ChaC
MTSWIFGYGSLMWRPDFPALERREGCVHGWERRFYQGSPDHRGTPQAPGRVVTLIPSTGAICWGVAYQLDPGVMDKVLTDLDTREQAGYLRESLEVHARDGSVVQALTYIAGSANANYLGEEPHPGMIEQLATAKGPSGTNADYLLSLQTSLEQLGVKEPHVVMLVEGLKAYQGNA